jgi:diguanylate cyclase (GGDEF)-like protein/putative nucleotidyltransferase with HDIG domain
MQAKLISAKFYIGEVIAIGALALLADIPRWTTEDPLRFIIYLLIAAVSSSMKLTLPGMKGTVSVGFLIVLVGIMELSRAEVLIIATVCVVIQCVWHTKRQPHLTKILFNVSCMWIAANAAYAVYHSSALRALGMGPVLSLFLAAGIQFLINAFPVACVIALSERMTLRRVWSESYFWSFPYYLVGAALAGGFCALSHRFGWQIAITTLPMVYFIYRTYKLYLARLEDEKDHAQKMAALHLRTIEALALAIDAKDATTHDHLRRVQVYAVEVGKEFGMSSGELDALRAAAVLHDIGKLAVPEHIISKPGRLTPEEFEKMKIHPIVGAEILEQVEFPYPVVPIVQAHHEKWDGSGYPQGLKGTEIPLGARILAAVDCLDALASNRQYRPAMPLDEAMEFVAREAHHSFDPQVVEVLQRRYRELEATSKLVTIRRPRLSKHLRIKEGPRPDAGFETSNSVREMDFLSSIAAATHEAQALFELSQALGNSLSLNETLSVLAMRLNRIVPYDAIAIYLAQGGRLVPEYVTGHDCRLLASLRIPIGEGLSGWVAHNNKPILNGNPSVEPGYLDDASLFTQLRSAVSVPLEGVNGVIGALTLYHNGKDSFSKDHLRVLLALSPKLALSVENALRYQSAESSATTDFLTGLPNARSLFLQLDSEVSRCKRGDDSLAVIVCDLDGFKQVNDRLGHLAGNRVLQMVARGLRESCREYDYVARMGGDEFVLILPKLPPELASARIDQIAEVIEEIGREIGAEDGLGVSIGEAYYPADSGEAEGLLAEADRRMYKVKQNHKSERTSQDFDSLAKAVRDGSESNKTLLGS